MNKLKCARCGVIYDQWLFREINCEYVCDFCSTSREKEIADSE